MKEELIEEIAVEEIIEVKKYKEPKLVKYRKGSVTAWRYDIDKKKLKEEGWNIV